MYAPVPAGELIVDLPSHSFCDVAGKLILGEGASYTLRNLPRPLVFTNGVFDIMHRGHSAYLQEARKLGASLLVALNTDASVRMLSKDVDRPLNIQNDRAFVIAALCCVSAVTLFDEATPCALLDRVRPDIYVKGGDYQMDQLEETRLMLGWGGRSVAIPFVAGYSTTALLERIRRPA
jgi:rfaE bifunctional protein nucleotidyltransferase chain/domain